MPDANLSSRFLDAARKHAEHVCIVEGERLWTWDEIARLVRLTASQIATLEPREGAAVGLLLPNSSVFAIGFFGALLARRVPMPMNPLLKPRDQAAQILDSGARLIFTISHFRDLIRKTAAELGDRAKTIPVYCDEIPVPPPPALLAAAHTWAEGGGIQAACELDPGATAVLLYTSGSTGDPKGVMLSHANLLSNIDSCLTAFQITDTDSFVSALPFFHVFGLMTCMSLPILSGLKLVAVPRVSADEILDAVARHRVSVLLFVPTMYRLLLASRRLEQTDFSCIRYAVSGGSPLSPSLVDTFKQKTGVEIFNGYGATETSPVIAVNNPMTHSRFGSVGYPIPGVEVRIVDLTDRDQVLPANETGEICVRGANVMNGYYNKPEATARAIDAEGWYRTGDLGRLDADGFLYVSGRVDDLIIVAGKNIHPEDVERALLQHPAVQEVAAVGLPDEMRGQMIAAFILLKPAAPPGPTATPEAAKAPTPAELRAFCLPRLANHQIPKEFHLVREFPRNPMGKIQKFRLVAHHRDFLP